MKPLHVGKHLIADPRVCHRKLTFKGTRILVQAVLYHLARGETVEAIREAWPAVSPEAIEEALRLAVVAWPELLQEPIAKSLQARFGQPHGATADGAAHEPAHPGRAG